jgi:RNA-binding protein YhbY
MKCSGAMRNSEEFIKILKAKPNCLLGKNGITKEFLNHIDQLLKRYKTIKIKVLKSGASLSSINDIANQISKATESYILDTRGKTIIISKQNLSKK